MSVRGHRKRLLRVVATATEHQIVRAALPVGMAGQRLRMQGLEELQISEIVPEQRVATVATHLLSHGTLAYLDAFGQSCCDGMCDFAAWALGESSGAIIVNN